MPIRYGRMLESPFRFYRGAAAIMAADLAPLPSSGLQVQLCGDAHPLNFRLLASPERRLVFDINDFDETLPGPFEWDVKRLAAGFVIAARSNGFSSKEQNRTVRACVRAYRERMREFAVMPTLDIWYAQDDADHVRQLLATEARGEAEQRLRDAAAKARTRTHMRAFAKLTRVTAEGRRITPDPPLITPLGDLLTDPAEAGREEELRSVVNGYARSLPPERRHLLRHYRLVDMARKVVGVGSVGTRCWVLLLLGRDDDDPLLLQAKEASESVLAAHTGGERYDHQGRRVVAGQRLIQTTGDIFLGWARVTGFDGKARDFYVRQLWDWKGVARPETMGPDLLSSSPGCAVPAWRGPTPVPVTPSRSPRTWAAATASTARSPSSPSPTPIRMNATTKLCWRPAAPAGSRPPVCEADPGTAGGLAHTAAGRRHSGSCRISRTRRPSDWQRVSNPYRWASSITVPNSTVWPDMTTCSSSGNALASVRDRCPSTRIS